ADGGPCDAADLFAAHRELAASRPRHGGAGAHDDAAHGRGRRPPERGRPGLPPDGARLRREHRVPGGARPRLPRPARAERLYRARADAAPSGAQSEAEGELSRDRPGRSGTRSALCSGRRFARLLVVRDVDRLVREAFERREVVLIAGDLDVARRVERDEPCDRLERMLVGALVAVARIDAERHERGANIVAGLERGRAVATVVAKDIALIL